MYISRGKGVYIVRIIDQEILEIAFLVVTPPSNSLELYIDIRVENPLQQSVNLSFSGFFLCNPVHNYYEGGTTYLHHRGSIEEQHFGTPCPPDNVSHRALDESVVITCLLRAMKRKARCQRWHNRGRSKQSSYNTWENST